MSNRTINYRYQTGKGTGRTLQHTPAPSKISRHLAVHENRRADVFEHGRSDKREHTSQTATSRERPDQHGVVHHVESRMEVWEHGRPASSGTKRACTTEALV